jgi:hypothetical protein
MLQPESENNSINKIYLNRKCLIIFNKRLGFILENSFLTMLIVITQHTEMLIIILISLINVSKRHFTSEYTILLGFRINIIRSLGSISISYWQYFRWKTTSMVRLVHNTYTSTRSVQLRLIMINHKDSMYNSHPKSNVQFYYRLRTIQSLRLQWLWTKILCDNLVTHTIDHIQCNPRAFHMHNIYNHY